MTSTQLFPRLLEDIHVGFQFLASNFFPPDIRQWRTDPEGRNKAASEIRQDFLSGTWRYEREALSRCTRRCDVLYFRYMVNGGDEVHLPKQVIYLMGADPLSEEGQVYTKALDKYTQALEAEDMWTGNSAGTESEREVLRAVVNKLRWMRVTSLRIGPVYLNHGRLPWTGPAFVKDFVHVFSGLGSGIEEVKSRRRLCRPQVPLTTAMRRS